MKIGPVDVQIEGLTESLKKKKNKKHEYIISPSLAALRSRVAITINTTLGARGVFFDLFAVKGC